MRLVHCFKRITAGAAVLAVAGAASLLTGGVASAQASNGTLTLSPSSGTNLSAPSVTTSGPCPTAANAYNVRVTGPNGLDNLATARTTVGFSTTDPITAAFGNTFSDVAALDTPPTTIVAGTYTVTLQCVSGLGTTVVGTFEGTVVFSSPTAWSQQQQTTTTTTALTSVTPPSPITAGTQSTLTATVTPANAVGTVQFFDNANPIGSPVTVTGGTASTATTFAAGSHSLTASFTGGTGFGNSATTSPVTYQVNVPQGAATSTSLSVNPSGTVNLGDTVTLSTTVTSGAGTPAGTVTFSDRGTALGAPIALTDGTATFTTSALALGTHSLTVAFTAANPAQFANSASQSVPLVVVQTGSSTVNQDITTEVLAGALVISVNNNEVTLPSPTLRPDAAWLETSGAINPVRVADTRAGNPGWTVSGQVSDFAAGPGKSINGANLGWTPNVVASLPVQNITPGPTVTSAPAVLPGAASSDPSQGLAASRTLAAAAAGGGTGTADLGAGLALNVPTSTTAGVYTATLTLTAI